MGITTIEWADYSFNPWIGCTKVSPACDNCYAAVSTPAKALGVEWGAGQPRRRTAVSNWAQPYTWNRKAAKAGMRRRVFCASLADVFDAEVPDDWRHHLFNVIAETPHLDWLLLTKRPNLMLKFMRDVRREVPPNIWAGATVENQAMAEQRIPLLLQVPAAKRFLSCEPLLGPVDLGCIPFPASWPRDIDGGAEGIDALRHARARLDWIIAGGESGPGARPSHPDWFRSLRAQCAAAGVPYFFKQWGDWAPQVGAVDGWAIDDNPEISRFEHRDWEGDHWSEPFQRMWCDDVDDDTVSRIGKKRAGRLLDGKLHDEVPA